ncbi:MAG: hypothetical protein JJT76_14610 [Clostridiaceae bacterium]|nr:hypothetical protein [Clostridiaceae bacterium]
MSTWSNQQRVCATCRYWSGRREMDFSAIFFTAKDEKGRCNGPIGSFRMVDMNHGASCSFWEVFR